MEAKEVLQQIGQYLYMAGIAIKDGAVWLWKVISAWYATLPLPTAIKLFSNDMANRYLFFGISVFLLIMNIWAFALFGSDKSKAKRKQRRVREGKLFRICFFGGAVGGMIGMHVFNHKTQKKRFSVGIPILFVLQLIIDSFVLGFLAFWTFF
ncbi:MAG: DUF1294 domain-containing protein [Clostridia bacterium]|nr:DUF1294 domain-containing protein [Clostridia bacterium]